MYIHVYMYIVYIVYIYIMSQVFCWCQGDFGKKERGEMELVKGIRAFPGRTPTVATPGGDI